MAKTLNSLIKFKPIMFITKRIRLTTYYWDQKNQIKSRNTKNLLRIGEYNSEIGSPIFKRNIDKSAASKRVEDLHQVSQE